MTEALRWVGMAPLRPAKFVIFRITRGTGESRSSLPSLITAWTPSFVGLVKFCNTTLKSGITNAMEF